MNDAGPKPAEPAAADLCGRQIGDFHILRRLGRGAMAEVYLAEQRPLKRWVALKVLKPELADDQTYLKRFEREAQAAASLVHANIVQIHEVGQQRRPALHRPGIRAGPEPPRMAFPPRPARAGPGPGDHAAGGLRAGQGRRARASSTATSSRKTSW